MQVVITTNSPGETAAWVRPVALALFKLGVHVDVVVTPCTFASGKETAFLLKQEGIRNVYPPERYWAIATGREKIPREQNGCVLFLGGDILHAKRLGKILNYPVAIYSTGRADKNVDLVFVPNQKVKSQVLERVKEEKVKIVGDLMLSSLSYRQLPKNNNQIALFPGSRGHMQSILPFFLATAEEMKQRDSSLEFVISFSPFIGAEKIKNALKKPNQALGGVCGQLTSDRQIETNLGLKIPYYQNRQYEIMETSTLALTIPGTNTAEMAFYGLPMVVVLPLNIAREIPLEGLVGLIGSIPFVGPIFKEKLIWKKASTIKFTALPNLLVGKEIVPEVRGFLSADNLASFALEIFNDKRLLQEISKTLLTLYPENNADELIANTLVRRWGSARR